MRSPLAAFSRGHVTKQKPLLGRCAHTILAAASPHTPAPPVPKVQAPWRPQPQGGAQVTVPREPPPSVLSPPPGLASGWQQAGCARVQLPPLLGICPFRTGAPGLTVRGLLLSHVLLWQVSHGPSRYRQFRVRGEKGRCRERNSVCEGVRKQEHPDATGVLVAGPHSGHFGTVPSHVHNLPCCSHVPHLGNDFLPASCV